MEIRRGHRGEKVKILQRALSACGFDLEDNGIFDRRTEEAVKDFQRRFQLKVDGIAGKDTLPALGLNPDTLQPEGEVINIVEKSPVDPDLVLAKAMDYIHYCDRVASGRATPWEQAFPLGELSALEIQWMIANRPGLYQQMLDAWINARAKVRAQVEDQLALSTQRFGARMAAVGRLVEPLAAATLIVATVGMALTIGAGVAGGVGISLEGAPVSLGPTILAPTIPGTAYGLEQTFERFTTFVLEQIRARGGCVDAATFLRIYDMAVSKFGDVSRWLP